MIVDSNVLIDLFRPDSTQSELVADAFRRIAAESAALCVNHVIVAEVSPSFQNLAGLMKVLGTLGCEVVPLSLDDAFRAGTAFRDYRRNGGPRTSILPDFLIAAQAENRGWPILTRDPKRFSSYFADVKLIDPLADFR